MKFDLHIHTSRHSPDGIMDPFAMVQRAREVGLDGVVITEHDWLWTEPELDELRAAAPDLVVLSGVEVSAKQGHFLTYGIKNPFEIPRGIDVADLCKEMHRQGGVVVAAHPFRWGQRFDDILRERRPALAGLELMSSNMDDECRQQTARVFARGGFAGLGNSDAHDVDVLGCCCTEFPEGTRTIGDVVEAIRAKKTTACRMQEEACGSLV